MKVLFCLLMTSLIGSIKTEENNVNAKFVVEYGKQVVLIANTINEFAASKVMCAMMCIPEAKCCEASYKYATFICRMDTSENFCVTMEPVDGWEVIKNDIYESACTGCISYEASNYKIINDDIKSWDNAKTNCKWSGGKLLEVETEEENSFIKYAHEYRKYWLGGYSFNKDGSFEWISNPGQPLTYSDMHQTQPSHTTTQFCLLNWKLYGYAWGDGICSEK